MRQAPVTEPGWLEGRHVTRGSPSERDSVQNRRRGAVRVRSLLEDVVENPVVLLGRPRAAEQAVHETFLEVILDPYPDPLAPSLRHLARGQEEVAVPLELGAATPPKWLAHQREINHLLATTLTSGRRIL